MAYVLRAHHVHDVDSNDSVIEITTIGLYCGFKKDFIHTKPRGDWQDISFHQLEYMDYAEFLRLMVIQNHEVKKKIATIELLHFTNPCSVKVMNRLKLLDPTFRSPRINIKNGHHLDLVNHINTVVAPRILNECEDTLKLTTYANALRRLR